jgi:starch synthase
MIASECEPWAKTGGLGDVVDALARALGHPDAGGSPRVDAPVDVFLPRYRSIAVPAGAVATAVRVPDPASSDGATDVGIVSVDADGYRLRLVDLPAAFDRDGYYGTLAGDHPDNAWRFGMLCRSALETMRVEARPVDVVHVHDWQGAPAVLYRDAWYWGDFTLGRTAFVLTLHNPAFHGWTHAPEVWTLGLPAGFGDAYGLDILRTGIERADMVNTVSPTFAREARTPEMGKGLDWVLAGRGDRFIGILNGIDTAQWDPATDATLAATYGPDAMAGKAACRAALARELGFDPDAPGPIAGAVGRLDPQKGFDLVADAADAMVAAGTRLVVLGSGDPAIADRLREAAAAHPDRVAVRETFDRDLARRIYAGSDLFLMPSRFEPSGQSQMIAMRYGTPPVVRATGGLADSVVDADASPDLGTGWSFVEESGAALAAAVARATAAYLGPDRSRWDAVVAHGMARDWSWEAGPVAGYLDMYRRAIAARR